MALFLIQGYNSDMTELVSEERKEFEHTEDALIEAYVKAGSYDVVVLMRQNSISHSFKKIAKLY